MTDTSTSDAVGVDPSRAAIARVYDALLGGKDNYEIDREAAQQLDESAPSIATIARDNRAFLGRVTRFLANTVGIDQFLDCGSGLPPQRTPTKSPPAPIRTPAPCMSIMTQS